MIRQQPSNAIFEYLPQPTILELQALSDDSDRLGGVCCSKYDQNDCNRFALYVRTHQPCGLAGAKRPKTLGCLQIKTPMKHQSTNRLPGRIKAVILFKPRLRLDTILPSFKTNRQYSGCQHFNEHTKITRSGLYAPWRSRRRLSRQCWMKNIPD